MSLIANARMYAVDVETVAAWSDLFARVATLSGVDLTVVAHPAPAPLEALWRRQALGLAVLRLSLRQRRFSGQAGGSADPGAGR